jgi:hypothetical protein
MGERDSSTVQLLVGGAPKLETTACVPSSEGGSATRLESGVLVRAVVVGHSVEDGLVDEADRRAAGMTLLRPRKKPRQPLTRIVSVVAPLLMIPPSSKALIAL